MDTVDTDGFVYYSAAGGLDNYSICNSKMWVVGTHFWAHIIDGFHFTFGGTLLFEKLEHRCKCEVSLVYVTLCELPHVNHVDSPQMPFYLLLTGGNV